MKRVRILFCILAAFAALTLASAPAQAGTTCTPYVSTSDIQQFTITATLDADTTVTCTHSMGVKPVVIITPLVQTTAALSLWAATTINNTQVVLTKATTMGSGGANPQVLLIVMRQR
jgi:hypothetical protein